MTILNKTKKATVYQIWTAFLQGLQLGLPKYGTMEDMDNLIDECHKRCMKLILDLVINHTSSEHQWFKESRSSKDSRKRDRHIWQPPKCDEAGNTMPPNNWSLHFSESAWEWDEGSQEYYLHFLAKTQPDLNLENEATKQAIYKTALTFWFEKGAEGFRIDTADMYSKQPTFENAPIVFPCREIQPADQYSSNGPRIHEFHKDMFSQVTSKYDVMTDKLKYVSAKEGEMNMMEDKFGFIGYDLVDFKKAVLNMCYFIKGTDAWSTIFIGNHDQPRSISRFGDESSEWLFKHGKLLATMITTLTGTLFLYHLDICTINYLAKYKEGKTGEELKVLKRNINLLARDNSRNPVQWNASKNGGFSTGKPWMRVNDSYKYINAASQALSVRKELKDALIHGELDILSIENMEVLSYVKTGFEFIVYVVLNFTNKKVGFNKLVDGYLDLVLTNQAKLITETLSPWEARVYTVSN
ncbi:glycoside hydrolase [Metschnikowia bicuspidata]|uniref:Glycoside hydrolase n=1 Tax=Metschnikowia bicuspidata TaxID=27322 RepID=A0A4P9ZBW9_9ASCO|nr:glycoside hydrolase [Metschnikowia bicuspidata]